MGEFDLKYQQIWDQTISSIKNEVGQRISDQDFYYFTNSRLYDCNDTTATIVTPLNIESMIMNSYRTIIETHLSDVMKKDMKAYIVWEEEIIPTKQETQPITNEYYKKDFGSEYTFANFVTGKSNSMAQIACLTCANNLGLAYNPLFIHGNSGLGKTHLLKALANKVLELDPTKKIIYISGEEFVDEVKKASMEKKFDVLKESFYDTDVLIVDDIQFISGNREKSQEIFFSIFSHLVNDKKQICIAADKKPDEIIGLEERIITRFNQGLVVSITSPEYETACQIVSNKLKGLRDNFTTIDDDVIEYIATNMSHDVRSLEGAITSLLFYVTAYENTDHIDLNLAKKALINLVKENTEDLNIGRIKKEVCNFYNISSNQLISSNRTKTITVPRQIAMYLCRKHLDTSYETIGLEFGNRDHSTVISSCEKIADLVKVDQLYKEAISQIEGRLFNKQSA